MKISAVARCEAVSWPRCVSHCCCVICCVCCLFIIGQIFCDLHTLLHSFYGFPGAFYKVTISICHVEGWTFVGLNNCIISILKQNKVQDKNLNFICVTYTHFIYQNPWRQQKHLNCCKNSFSMIFSLQMERFVQKKIHWYGKAEYIFKMTYKTYGQLNKNAIVCKSRKKCV